MPKGKAKTRFDFSKDKNGKAKGCEFENNSWCNLSKYKRCEHCLRCTDGSKACKLTAF